MLKNKYVFFGSPEFAARILTKLVAAKNPPVLVITNPDRPQGRKMDLTPPPAKLIAEQSVIPVFQPKDINAGEVKNYGADFGLVAAYSKILTKEVLSGFPRGVLGIHPSLLPKYRGASPIQSALMRGEKETGVSLYVIDEKMDHGPVLGEKKVKIEEIDDYFSLEEKLADAGAELFLKLIPGFLGGGLTPLLQDEDSATFTKKFKTEDAFLKPDEVTAALKGEGAEKVFNAIRAFAKEPVAWTYGSALPGLQTTGDKRVKLLSAKMDGGALKILRVQIEGKSPKKYLAAPPI